jgi:hypothetical protein
MISVLGTQESLRNLVVLASMSETLPADYDLNHLRRQYLRQLAKIQPDSFVNFEDDIFITDPASINLLRAAFTVGKLNDLRQDDVMGGHYEPDDLRGKILLARDALTSLMSMNEDFAIIFATAIHSVFIVPDKSSANAKGSRGGSSSASIGSIWLSAKNGVSTHELAEMYVHELTHHLLFIDELNHEQFYYKELSNPSNFARSAILKRDRPLDKVVHSIVVAAELLQAREQFLGGKEGNNVHPPSRHLATATIDAIESVYQLKNIDRLVTARVFQLLDSSRRICVEVQ